MTSDLLLIAALILLNGFFASAEMAVVSARTVQLQAREEAGDSRAARALRLRRRPGEFLTTVQVGITLVGTLASAIGGLEAARWLAPRLAQLPGLSPYADQIAVAAVVVSLSYASLVVGELVPKRLAIRQPERWAMAVAGTFEFLSRLAAWPVRFLLASADLILRLFGDPSPQETRTSSEEIELLVRRGTAQGVFLPQQRRMITRIFEYGDRMTRDAMTPRTEIISLEVASTTEQALQIAKTFGFSRYPVHRANLDEILGYVHIKDLILTPPDMLLEKLVREVVFIPEGASLPQAFTLLTRAGRHLGIVLDEFGGTEGLITLEDLLEEIVGEIEDEHSPVADESIRGGPELWSIAGGTSIAEVEHVLGIDFDSRGAYTTLGGFIMAILGEIPQEGDAVERHGYRFDVESMDRFRIQTVRVQRVDQPKN